MRIESRYNLGQSVWYIHNVGREQFVPCPSCQGGNIPLPDGRSLDCPRCAKKGAVALRRVHRYIVSQKLTVGQIQLTVGGRNEDDAEKYMAHETGVGSGSVYYAKDLYPSLEEAQAACDRLNHEPGKAWSCVRCNPQFETVQYSGWNEYRHCMVHEYTNHVDPDKAEELLEVRKKAQAEREAG